MTTMKTRRFDVLRRLLSIPLALAIAWAPSSAGFAQTPSPSPAPPQQAQHGKIDAGLVSVPITVREQFLGKSGEKTVMRFTLEVSRSEVKAYLKAPPRVYSFFITGEAKNAEGKVVDTFRLPVEVDLSTDDSLPITARFLRSLPPGPTMLDLRLDGVTGKAVAVKALSINVPAMSSEFVAEDAGLDAQGNPIAAAVVLESENRTPLDRSKEFVRILLPKKEVPVGLIRIEVEVEEPVTRVEFVLEDKKILTRNRPPYTVELDLGKIPRKQTLKAIGYDSRGNFVDLDAWAINERDARLAVRILEIPKKMALGGAAGTSPILGQVGAPQAADEDLDVKVAVQSIAGGVLKSLKLYLDTDLIQEWKGPPYTVKVPAAKLKKATLLRATAFDADGKEYTDFRILKGDQRFLATAEVHLVELNVSVYDKAGLFVKGLKQPDFSVLEDGKPQELSSFEFAESLPISLGIVIDGSGSMKDAMPLVHQAASEFVTSLIGEKDQGFVMDFRETPTLITPMTNKRAALLGGVRETSAKGGTALYDSVVMALYQFRSVQGRKAIVLLSDGQDNKSWTEYETLRRYVRTAGVPIYIIGLDISFVDVGLKSKLADLANDTGGSIFYVSKAAGLPEIYKRIETELRSQYFLTYLANSPKPADQFRAVEVRLKNKDLRPKTIRGYFP